MAVTQYTGSRYVPLFADPIDWSSENTYEPLTIVTHEGNSYTSKQYVPKGIKIDNQNFWALTGNYNAQIEQYRREVSLFDNRISENTAGLSNRVPMLFSVKDYGAIGDGVVDDTDAVRTAIAEAASYVTNNQPFITNTGSIVSAVVFFPAGVYHLTDTITIPQTSVSYSGRTYQSVVRLAGSGEDVTVLKFTDNSRDGIRIEGANSGVSSMSIIGGLNGIHAKASNDNGFCPYGKYENIHINGCSGAALLLENVYVTTVKNIIGRATNGIRAIGEGTSLNIENCYMIGMMANYGAGYYLEDYVYSSICNCQTDGMKNGYEFKTGNTAIKRASVLLTNCGCENPYGHYIKIGDYDYLDMLVDMFAFTGNSNNASSLVSTGNYLGYCNITFNQPFINNVGTTIVFDNNSENVTAKAMQKNIRIQNMATFKAITNLLTTKNAYFTPMQYVYLNNPITTGVKSVMQFNEKYCGEIEIELFRNADNRYIKKTIGIDSTGSVSEIASFTENPNVDVTFSYDPATFTLKVSRTTGSANLADFYIYANVTKKNTGFKMLDGVAE